MRRTKEMKKLEEWLKRPYSILITPDPDGGYVAEVPELPGCITQGDTWEEVIKMIEDAKRAWIETALQRGKEIPEPKIERKFSGRFVIRVSKSLHRRLSELAEKEGVSLNTLVVQLLTEGVTRKEHITSPRITVGLKPSISDELQKVDWEKKLMFSWVSSKRKIGKNPLTV